MAIITDAPYESSRSAVSWPAIIAGAFTAVAISLILFVLGSAYGLSELSPWDQDYAAADSQVAAFTAKTAIFLIVVQWLASGFGGYLTGRLRTKWASLHDDEIFFRDTAHGFLSWAVSTVFVAGVAASTIFGAVSGGLNMSAQIAAGAASNESVSRFDPINDPVFYYTDSILRSDSTVTTVATDRDLRGETSRILARSHKEGKASDSDKSYLSRVIATRNHISPEAATQRVDELFAQMDRDSQKARETAEAARKSAQYASLFIALSLVLGAFIGSTAAAIGGRHRDQY